MGRPAFDVVERHALPLADGIAREAAWMADAATHGRAQAHLWQGEPGWTVPQGYLRTSGTAALEQPLQVRASGGGLVPLGPGLLNLSCVWRSVSATPAGADAIYHDLCGRLTAAIAQFGIRALSQAVDGAFCDGRFNLAVGGRKLAGTAQSWRRIEGTPVILAHAAILVDADPGQLAAEANAIEARLGHARRYRHEALTTLAQAWREAHGARAPVDLMTRLCQALSEQLIPTRRAAGALAA